MPDALAERAHRDAEAWPEAIDAWQTETLGGSPPVDGRPRSPVHRQRARRAAPRTARGQLPHGLGNPAEDPFVRVNGYVMRDDPGGWRDSFVLAVLLHHRLTGDRLDRVTWDRLRMAA